MYVRFGGYGIGISTRGAILIIEDYKSIYTGADSEQGENDQVSIGGQTNYKVEALKQDTKDLALSLNLIFFMSQVQNALSKEHKIECLRKENVKDPSLLPLPPGVWGRQLGAGLT